MNIYRQKLLNAVLFFAKRIRRLNTTKLAKLLYNLDFKHFQQTGYPSIGLLYYAYKQGPLPIDFWKELVSEQPHEDLSDLINIIEEHFDDGSEGFERRIIAKPKTQFDDSLFTPREMDILNELVEVYKDYDAVMYSEASHELGSPWDKTRKSKGDNELIDYMLAIDDKAEVSMDDALEGLKEYFSLLYNFRIEPVK
ncbi:MAG: Panacea domain-containing protein [Candidatus Hatepunaea meridiana]|nr:Panacea domain-containing protein [Candidatus Hatepunaea meridiana]